LAADERILVVDDEPLVNDIIAKCLEAEGYVCDIADSAEAALKLLENQEYALVVADINMPGRSGIELLSIIKEQYSDVAVIMVTAVDDRKIAIQALQLGAFGYVIKPFDLNEMILSVVNALKRRQLTLQSKEYELRLEREVKERTAELHLREDEICYRLTAACEYRDEETSSHNRRLGLYAAVMAKELGWKQKGVDEIRISATMHDIGKIGVPDNVLFKQGRLSPEEFVIVKTHTSIGAKILSDSNISLLELAETIALSHHEKWDGTGYPNGLKGKDTPEAARLSSIVDVYDALVHDRIYRAAIPEVKALEIMEKDKGFHFDPDMFEIFLKVLPQLRDIRMRVTEETI
jgi:putative two-component system response regulator